MSESGGRGPGVGCRLPTPPRLLVNRSRAALILAFLVAGCSARQQDGGSASAVVSQPGLSCRQATRVARGALVRLGYTIDSVEPAQPSVPGKVVGRRQTGWSGPTPEAGEVYTATVTVTCSESGAELAATADEPFMRRVAFGQQFDGAVKTVVENETQRSGPPKSAPAAGLVITVRPLLGSEAAREFGADLSASGITAVQVELDNRSSRAYLFDPERLQLYSEGGERKRSLSSEKAAAGHGSYLEEQLRARSIAEAAIEPGKKLAGFLYFPAAAYSRATLQLTDRESGETEGFRVEF